MKVSLFITCLTDLFAPQVGLAVVKSLEYFGCQVDFPAAQTCCGQPQFNNGYFQEAQNLARRMIKVFQGASYVVTPSGSCGAMVKEHYPGLFTHDPAWGRRAEDLAGRCYEYVDFLTRVLKVDLHGLSLPEKTTFTYHYNCHLRGLGLTGEPARRLLEQIGNVTLLPLEKAEQCCGFGGTFAVKYPDISGAMVRDKIACAARSGAAVMIVNDGGCAMNIAGAGHRNGEKFVVRHLAEVIAAAIEHTAAQRKANQG